MSQLFFNCVFLVVSLTGFIRRTESVSIQSIVESMSVSKSLDLSSQNIDSIENATFSNVSFNNVEYLYLSWNKLTSLNESDFLGLNNLVKVSTKQQKIFFFRLFIRIFIMFKKLTFLQ